MKAFARCLLLSAGLGAVLFANTAAAQNPLILDQFTADPTARVFEGKIYVYPSHDINTPGKGRPNWFVMEDYHVFSSENLVDWTDHGVILDQTQVPWLENKQSFSMWAPDCVFKNGKYYFYYPTGGRIGVAIADKPYGPFKPEEKAIEGPRGIDPCVFIDKDGNAYLYYSRGKIFVAKLKPNMVELETPPQEIPNLPTVGLIEGPFVFERNGIYYLTYPHVANKIERLEYAVGKSPMGPFEFKGVIMDESASGCWTNHHSLVEYKGQWYLFYHDQDLSPAFDKNRSIHADYLSFNADGTIQKVIPTLRGVGIVDAKKPVQIDRFSAKSTDGTAVSYLDDSKKGAGWKIGLTEKGAWVQFNKVDFGKGGLKNVAVRSMSASGGVLEIRLDKADAPVLARIEVGPGTDWTLAKARLAKVPAGVHDLFVTLTDKKSVDVDWITFE